MKTTYIKFLFLIVLILLPICLEAQCAMCKATVEISIGQKNSVAGGLNQGILYLMAVPYVLMAFIFRKQLLSLWRNIRGKDTGDEDDV